MQEGQNYSFGYESFSQVLRLQLLTQRELEKILSFGLLRAISKTHFMRVHKLNRKNKNKNKTAYLASSGLKITQVDTCCPIFENRGTTIMFVWGMSVHVTDMKVQFILWVKLFQKFFYCNYGCKLP